MIHPLYCSFYAGEGYAKEAAGLVETLTAWRLPYVVEERADAGSWEKNCGGKAAFLLDVRRRHPNRPLVWLDADARVREYPSLFDYLTADIGAHWMNHIELLSGTLFIGTSSNADKLLKVWRDGCEASPSEWDQRVLQRIITDWQGPLSIADIPASYCAIFDANMATQPVIEHMQASRRLRR